jgi:hypothetical protein
MCPATGSLLAASPFPPAGSRRARFPRYQRYYEGATTSHPRINGHLFDSLPPPTLSSLLRVSPQRSWEIGGSFQAGFLLLVPANLPRLLNMDANGISQVSRRSFPCLCSAPRPRTNRCVLAMAATSMLPPPCAQRRLRQLGFRGSLTQLRHLLSYASRFVLPLARKARFRLAGWPLPGGRRTLWTAARGFSSC